ncbi:hypothetical protein F7725_007569 [Dissostichus mawsoni]|uniref:G-protein coupled receptors family 1 profile domain-containing protein n=1 Tax=Dissostichus mawsoni TaxID=36200 RepID=A0A7J5Y4R9_DISMA|nr:hypothetical protein F7725_007569 [Dissostichus mawsoni]
MGIELAVNMSDEVSLYGGKSAFTQMEHNIVAGYLITAGIVSLASNIVVLLMFVKFKELRTATNIIIINLALTDIGVAGIGYPMSAASDIHGSWKFGYTGCQIYAALNIFFGMASIGLLTVVAIDRYLTICRPDIGQKMTMRSYNLIILAAWLNAVFWSSMPVVGWASYAPDPTGATCTINWRNNDASFISYTMAVIAVNFIVPLSVMLYCYYNVSVTMKRYKASNGLNSINMDWTDQMDVTKMSIVMIVMFLVAWSPYSIVCLWASFGDPKRIPAAMAIIAPLFAKSSTFYNPCIYVQKSHHRNGPMSNQAANHHQYSGSHDNLPTNSDPVRSAALFLALQKNTNLTKPGPVCRFHTGAALEGVILQPRADLFLIGPDPLDVVPHCLQRLLPGHRPGTSIRVLRKKCSIYGTGREKYVSSLKTTQLSLPQILKDPLFPLRGISK